MTAEEQINKLIEDKASQVSEAFIKFAQEELINQGHVLSGKILEIDHKEKQEISKIISEIYLQDYYLKLDEGVPPGTFGDVSELTNYFLKRGVGLLKEAKRAAFFTARSHFLEGVPTRGSYAFSRNGRRTGFIQEAVKKIDPVLTKIFEDFAKEVQNIIDGYTFTVKIEI